MWRFLRNKPNIILLILIASLAFFYLLNLRGGHDWGDDFALYISHAQNLAQGRAYAATGYIFNPDLSNLSPKAYPPVFPFLLAPIVAIFGVNLALLKLVGLVCFIVFLVLFADLADQAHLPLPARGLLIASVGLHPLFWSATDRILSDLPFLMICTLALIQMQALISRKKAAIRNGIGVGLLIYLAYGTRSVGLVLLPVLLLAEVFANRKVRLPIVGAAGIALALMSLQAMLIPETGSYLSTLTGPVMGMTQQLIDFMRLYYDSITYLFPIRDELARHLLFDISLVLASVGYIQRLQKGETLYPIFVLAYLAAILVWPAYQGIRFLIPILPFFLLFAYEGGFFIVRSLGLSKPMQGIGLIGLCLILSICYRDGQKIPNFQRVDNINTAETNELFSFVRQQIPADARIIFVKPRALSLFTGRKSGNIAIPETKTPVEVQLARFQADFLVCTANDPENQAAWQDYLARMRPSARLIYETPQFRVYQLN